MMEDLDLQNSRDLHTNRNLRLIDAYTICASCLCYLPIIVLFYRDEIGLDFADFMLGEALFAVCMVLLEVPGGYISDIWQRRYVLAASAGFHALATLLIMFAGNLLMALIAQAVFAVAVSLFSGTVNAFLYDTLAAAGRQDEYRKREGRRTAISLYTIASSALVGGLLYKLDPHLPLVVALLTDIMALAVILFATEPPRIRLGIQKHPLADMLATMKYCLHGHKEVGRLMILGALCFSATKLAMWSQQPYYQDIGLDVVWFGVLSAIGWQLSGMASHNGHRLDRFATPSRSLNMLMLVIGGLMLVAGLSGATFNGWLGVAALLAATAMYGMGIPRFHDALNRAVDGSRRATVLSTASLLIQLCNFPVMIVYGWVSDHIGLGFALCSMGLFIGLFGLWALYRPLHGQRGEEPAKSC